MNAIELISYSEKAIAVIGETKPIKEQLKALGGRFNVRLSCGAGWIFPKTKQEEVQALIGGEPIEISKPQPKTDGKFKDTLKEYKESKGYDDYSIKNAVGAIKINDSFLLLPKPTIETRFCFYDEGPNYELYKSLRADDKKMADYFVADNKKELQKDIAKIKERGAYLYKEYDGRLCVSWREPHISCKDKCERADEATTALIVEGLEYALSEFDKRLQTYLKRYGISKLNTWTFWADR